MCQVLDVSPSGYYNWLSRSPSPKQVIEEQLIPLITDIFSSQRYGCGTRVIKKVLSRQRIELSRRRIDRLMKQAGLICRTRRKFKATTDSKHSLPVAPNLLDRKFTIARPNRAWVGDITYVWTNEGWLYLATVIDLFSRRVVGWSMDKRLKASLVNDALLMALWQRKPERGLLWHTDRGSQYASDSHKEILVDHGIIQSMSRRGNCWDNAVAESFFHTIKVELIHRNQFQTRNEAKQAIFDYIEVFYNRQRLHSTNDYWSPADYETIKNVA